MSDTRDALLVGCSDYEDSEFPQLPAPAHDLDALEHVLANPTIGNFTVWSLLNEPSGEVRERIERFFADRKPDDLLLLYLSCHGELLDCCYSGAFAARGNGGKEIREQVRQLGGRGRVVITASGKTEQAFGSRFTNAVVQGLETGQADLDGDGQVSVSELYQYVYDRVAQGKPSQTPTMSGRVEGQLYLANNPRALLPLPAELEAALTSEIAWKRRGAVDGLRRLLADDHPVERKRTARKALDVLCRDADPGVRKAAKSASRRVSRQHHRNRRLVGAGLALVGMLLVAALVWPSDPPPSCSPSVKPADGVLSLGTLLPKTGSFVYNGPAMDAGVDLAFKDINAAGGIPSTVVKLDEANRRDEGNPSADTAGQSTDALLVGGVDAIIGPATSAAARKVIDRAVCAGVIMSAPGTTSSVFTTYSDRGLYFRTAPSNVFEGSALGKLVIDDGNSTVVVMSRDDEYGNDLRGATVKAIEESGGRVLDSFRYDPSARDYDKDIQRVKAKDPDAIILIGFNESAQILVKMIEEGLGPRSKRVYGSGANMTNTLVGQVRPQDPSVLTGMKGTPLDPGDEVFRQRLREAYPGLRDLSYGAHAYDAMVITVLAAAVAGTDAPAAIAREINDVTRTGERCVSFAACMTLVKDRKDIDYDGPSGPLEFIDPGEPCSAIYSISEIQADGSVKSLGSVRVGPPC